MATQTATRTDLTGTWAIDPAHSRLGFAARHAMVTTVRGSFESFEGTFRIDEASPERSTAEIVIQGRSIQTGNAQRDAHLRTNDFIDVDNFPTLHFRSTRLERRGREEFRVYGDLSIKGVTREVALDVTFQGTGVDPYGQQRAGFAVTGTINRRDWGVNWNAALESGGILVSDKVQLDIDVSAVRQS